MKDNALIWRCKQITKGTERGVYHSHSYYDLPSFDATSRYVAAYQMHFQGRLIVPEDTIQIGYIDTENDNEWIQIGESKAWSWQQGPMLQWLPNSRRILWNDRDKNNFIARIFDLDTNKQLTLPWPVYSVHPEGKMAATLNFARLNHMRPGYGYAGIASKDNIVRAPQHDGVWLCDMEKNLKKLILSYEDALKLIKGNPFKKEYWDRKLNHLFYWFNHIKFSPNGKRFTVKFRYRHANFEIPWNDSFSYSLTCGTDGCDQRCLTKGASHVMWYDDEHVYLWCLNGLFLYKDDPGGGRLLRQMGKGVISQNVHAHYLPGQSQYLLYDLPYRENVELNIYREDTGDVIKITSFNNHIPASNEFRCDLHPCISPDGKKIVVTSLQDGGRQVYLLCRE